MSSGNPPRRRERTRFEWPTFLLLFFTYSVWATVTIFYAAIDPWLALPILAMVLAFHSSLQHEIIHGHPFRDQRLNDALVFPAIGLLIPYERFRTTHLAHHFDPLLTDPYDDPESNYLDPAVWNRLRRPTRAILALNNTLIGRVTIGAVLPSLTAEPPAYFDAKREFLVRALKGSPHLDAVYVGYPNGEFFHVMRAASSARSASSGSGAAVGGCSLAFFGAFSKPRSISSAILAFRSAEDVPPKTVAMMWKSRSRTLSWWAAPEPVKHFWHVPSPSCCMFHLQ